MLRKIGLAISYFVATLYILLILLPTLYCYQHDWCKGPAEGDAFMPAFLLAPAGAVATAFALRNAIQQIRKRHAWSWVFWPLATVFAIVLLGTAAFFAWMIYETASHR